MKVSQAAVFETKKASRARIIQGLRKAGLKVTDAQEANALRKEGLVVIGPSLAGARVAKAARAAAPNALVVAAMPRPKKVAWADAVLPLPISAADLKLRVPEWVELRKVRQSRTESAHEPAQRPGEGILDPLTGFYTFTHFKEVLFIEVKRARRYNFPLSLAIVGVDPMPEPITGELRERLHAGLALAIRRSLRDTDFPVQYDADHVALLMPHTDLQGAMVVSRRITERVARATLHHHGRELHPTLSVGVAAAPHPSKEFSFSELVKHAQAALARAIENGGNRVEFSTPDPADFPTETVPVLPAEPLVREP
ncbi:MAG: diguanylate cyclase [Myxococcaceae bacterium]|nr:diguanylate cyclase [Myxococcaceae bacterium]